MSTIAKRAGYNDSTGEVPGTPGDIFYVVARRGRPTRSRGRLPGDLPLLPTEVLSPAARVAPSVPTTYDRRQSRTWLAVGRGSYEKRPTVAALT